MVLIRITPGKIKQAHIYNNVVGMDTGLQLCYGIEQVRYSSAAPGF